MVRYLRRVGAEFKQQVWGTICVCPKKTALAKLSGCANQDGIPELSKGTIERCGGCPFSIHTDRFPNAVADEIQTRTKSANSAPKDSVLAEVQALKIVSLQDFLNKSYLIDDHNKTMRIKDDPIFKSKDLKIGLSWKSVVSVYGKLKSLNLADFKPLIKKNRQFINLQYGEVKEEIKKTENKNFNIYSFEKINLFNDLDDLMSILKNLDIFVTVSNSTAHIAAAMGIKTLLICPKISSTYFYWSNENNKTPWYKNVEIFQIERSVKETIENINKVLNKL